ncbi:MAG: CCDC90 family protein [Magnetococcus sp. MYC-9]
MSTATFAIPFDTLAFVKKLETAGVPSAQAEAQAEALSGVLQKVEEYRLQELATKGDVELAKEILRKEIETAKVDIIKWVVTTGIVILGGVAALIRFVPPVPAYYQPPAQELRQPAPSPTLPALPAPTH